MKIQTITVEEVAAVLNAIPRSQIFTVLFTKKPAKGDLFGAERVMNCRRGVKAFLAPADPNKKKRAPGPDSVVKVFDMQLHDYRSFNVNSVKRISALGQQFVVA